MAHREHSERIFRCWPKDKPIPKGWVKVGDMAGTSHGKYSIIIEQVENEKAEDAVQSEVVRRVKELYPNVRIFAIRNESNRFKVEECDIGHPDLQLEAVYNFTTFILKMELKTKKGKLRQTQLDWNERFDDCWSYNCVRRVAYGTADALRQIEIWINQREESLSSAEVKRT